VDHEQFDGLVRALGSGATRRGALGVLAGIAGLGLGEVAARKKGRGKGKGRGKSKKSAKAKARADKVAVCHYDADQDTWVAINVSQAGWENGHAKHEKDFQQAAKDGCCLDRECAGLTDQCHVGKCVVNDDRVGACKAVATPGAICDGGTCDDSGDCIDACTPKTCAELGRTCGTAPDDGCGNPQDCGGDSVCGSDIETNCCGGRCCKANGIRCSSNAECCNGDCLIFLGFGTCNAFTNYTCAP
jgi:hypothetical protein